MTKCDDIAIIGAGIAGTYAAWRLRHQNKRISVYEYSNRVGGRLFTVRFPDITDINVELGGMRYYPEGKFKTVDLWRNNLFEKIALYSDSDFNTILNAVPPFLTFLTRIIEFYATDIQVRGEVWLAIKPCIIHHFVDKKRLYQVS